MTKKICEQCQAEKELELFHKVTNQYTALHPMGICKECYKSNNEERKRRQAQEWEARTAGSQQSCLDIRTAPAGKLPGKDRAQR